ncbi:hypothetical protein EZS27_004218 [termite gut metagenome]|uniref:DUF3876 domain-containing protein n=1 Tax=termite gut metagenome TaxID=433724 RepID=A0A5J4SQY6_9ZZZZ
MEEYQNYRCFPTEWLGAWESVNGNPDVYIYQGYDGNYYLLAYYYDKEAERGNFSCYEIDSDEGSYSIGMGMKRSKIKSKKSPYGLYITGWGSYMKC